MADVRIYTVRYCPFCRLARTLLEERGVEFEEVDVTGEDEQREQLAAETGQSTVPQVFIRGDSVGGYEELAELDRTGELERRLSG